MHLTRQFKRRIDGIEHNAPAASRQPVRESNAGRFGPLRDQCLLRPTVCSS
jgi:hypothetical protein